MVVETRRGREPPQRQPATNDTVSGTTTATGWTSGVRAYQSFLCLVAIIGTISILAASRPTVSSRVFSFQNDIAIASTNTAAFSAKAESPSSFWLLQSCMDEHTSKGSWAAQGGRWIGPPASELPCPLSFDEVRRSEDLLAAFANLTIGFMGDSTTRSDLRAWEEEFGCPRTNLDESRVFQKKYPNGNHVCQMHEQSINLTKCGVPPIIHMSDCPSPNKANHPVSFRYFYKVYPWTPLDEWYFRHRSRLFEDIDVLVISVGRWIPYGPKTNVTEDIERFVLRLQQIYSGLILFQSQYAKHTVPVQHSRHPVNCTHGLMNEKYQCEQTITMVQPQVDDRIRSVVVGRYRIPFLDRWKASQSLPLEYYRSWLCGKPSFHSWHCDHHLGFVAMEHFRRIASVVNYYRGDDKLPLATRKGKDKANKTSYFLRYSIN